MHIKTDIEDDEIQGVQMKSVQGVQLQSVQMKVQTEAGLHNNLSRGFTRKLLVRTMS